jgi:protein DGCR14
LSEIIKRDFFPQLHDLDTRKEIIKGLSSRDEYLVEESVRKMREICTPVANLSNNNGRGRKRINDHDTPGRRTRFDSPSSNFSAAADVTTPTTFDQTPFGTSFSETPPIFSQRQQRQRQNSTSSSSSHINTSLSLDAFQSRYTSQDNSSFSTLLARDNESRREKTRWAWEAEKKANEVQIRGRKARERLVDVTRQMIEGGEGEGGGDGSVWLLEGGKAGKPGERQVLVGKGIQLQQGDRERGLLMVARDEKERLKITQTDEKLLMILDSDSSSEKDVKGKGKVKETKVVIDDRAKQYVDWDRPAVEEEESNKPIERKDLQISVETWPFKVSSSLLPLSSLRWN